MAVQRTGTQFTLKGISAFLGGLKKVNKEFRQMGETAAKMSRNVKKAGDTASKAIDRQVIASKKLQIADQKVELAEMAVVRVYKKKKQSLEEQLRVQIRLDQALLNQVRAENELTRATNSTHDAITESIVAQSQVGGAALTAGAAIGALGVAFGALGIGLGAAVDVMRGFINVLKKIGGTILNVVLKPLRALASFARDTLATAFGVRLADSFRTVTDALNRMKNAAVSVISDFQTLEIRVQNLVARELRLSGEIDNVADSFSAAVGPASELTKWITELSLKVPFDVKDIANTTTFGLAMGFTTNEAKALTESIGNFAAGMGLSTDKMESMIFNFGQMKAAGKVTGTEMRDLARGAFFPLTDVLDEAARLLGRADESMTEFRKSAAAGEVPIDAFFKAFQTVVERDFPGAMERMAGTLQGVSTRFKNFFKTIIGIELLGPLFKNFAQSASGVLDQLLTPSVQKAARAIGETLVFAFERLKEVAAPIGDALKNLAEAFGFTGLSVRGTITAIANTTAALERIGQSIANFINWVAEQVNVGFGSIQENMYQWGLGLVRSFANGMASAVGAVVKVLLEIGRIIAYWLETFSPPRLLPKLGQWGAEAMTEYMQGWLAADFGVFNTIADKVESFIRSFTEDFISAENVIPLILRVRDQLAQAFNEIARTGEVSANILSEIFDGLANATPELVAYTELVLEVAKANKAVADAQENLNEVTAQYDAILKPMLDRLEEINDATLDLDGTRRATQLRLILADVNASEGDKQRARLELERIELEKNIRAIEEQKEEAVDGAQEQLTAAEEALAALEDQLAIQEGLIDTQIKTNELIKEQQQLLEGLQEALSGISEVDFEGIDFGFGFDEDFSRKVEGSLLSLEDIFDNARKNIDETWGEIATIFDEAFADVGVDIEELSGIWNEIFGENGSITKGATLFSATVRTLVVIIQTGLSDLSLAFQTASALWSEALGTSGDDVITLRDVVLYVVSVIAGIWMLLVGIVSAAVVGVSLLLTSLVTAFNWAKAVIEVWWDVVKKLFEDGRFDLIDIIISLTTGILALVVAFGAAWIGFFKGLITGIITIFQNLYHALIGGSIIPDMLTDITTAFTTFFSTSLRNLTMWILDVLQRMTAWATSMYTKGVNAVQGLWDGFRAKWASFYEWLKAKYAAALALWDKITKSESPSKEMMKRGQWLMEGLAIGIAENAELPARAIGQVAQTVVMSDVPGGNVTNTTTIENNHTLNMPTTSSPASVQRSFEVMRLMSA